MNRLFLSISSILFTLITMNYSSASDQELKQNLIKDAVKRVSIQIYNREAPTDLFEDEYGLRITFEEMDTSNFLESSDIDKDSFNDAMEHIFYGKTRQFLFNELGKQNNYFLVSVVFFGYQSNFGFYEGFTAYYIVDASSTIINVYEIGNSSLIEWENRQPNVEYAFKY